MFMAVYVTCSSVCLSRLLVTPDIQIIVEIFTEINRIKEKFTHSKITQIMLKKQNNIKLIFATPKVAVDVLSVYA